MGYGRNPEKERADARERMRRLGEDPSYRAEKREYAKRYHAANRKQQNDKRRKYQLKQYGLTPQQYEILWALQRGKCAICGQPETKIQNGNLFRLAVDHCHRTGQLRGLLCFKCNTAIGKFGEDAEILSRASRYVANGGGRQW